MDEDDLFSEYKVTRVTLDKTDCVIWCNLCEIGDRTTQLDPYYNSLASHPFTLK